MTHEERARQVEDELRLSLTAGDVSWIAEQFREVEREAQHEIREILGTERGRAAMALFHGMPLPEEMIALREKLRKIVKAGDALAAAANNVEDGAACSFSDPRVSYEEYQLEPGCLVTLRDAELAWGEQTKDIPRG